MNWANIGKKIVKAKELGKDLNKVNLGKYEPTTQAKRAKLAKGVRKLRKGGHKETAKKFAKNPEQFRGPRTFLTHEEQKKMGTSDYWLGPRKKKIRNPDDYNRGGPVGLRAKQRTQKKIGHPKGETGSYGTHAEKMAKAREATRRTRHKVGGRVAKRKR